MPLPEAAKRIDRWFQKDFRKRFVLCASIPLVLSLIYGIDFFVLMGTLQTERLIGFTPITISHSGGTAAGKQKVVGYQYVTENGIEFSTMKKKIKVPVVEVSLSPIFKTVKSVLAGDEGVEIESGINGISGLFFMICNSSIFIGIC